ncbi:MAG: methionyl-tRNA formyltransferase [Planctomycetota bacterium]|jgi:methionyl-tRNA formyltransferase
MNIVYIGSGEFGLNSLQTLVASDHKLALVVTQAPHKAGRGQRLRPTAVAAWAKSNSINCLEAENINEQQVADKIAEANPDLIVVIAFGQKISNQLIDLPSKGMINVHSSLLPKYRGAAPVNWAIINGEQQTGISIITVAEKLDAGDVLAQSQLDIEENETAEQLEKRLGLLAPDVLMETIQKIEEGNVEYTPQDDSKATKAPKLKKEDGCIDFDQNAETIKRRILGLWPWPGASAVYVSTKSRKQTRVTIAMVQCIETENRQQLKAGTFDDNLNVICTKNSLKIIKIKPAGSKIMDFKDFVNGHRTKPGDMLIKIEP